MKRLIDFIGVALAVTIVVCLVYGLKTRDDCSSEVVRDTVYKVIHDTVKVSEPVAVDERVVGEMVVPVSSNEKTKGDERAERTERAKGCEDLTEDREEDSEEDFNEDSVVLPITQRVYSDSNYVAYVSGYNAKLDSILFYESRKEILFSERIVPKQKKWSVGLSVGYGVGKGGVGPIVGVSVQRKIWEF